MGKKPPANRRSQGLCLEFLSQTDFLDDFLLAGLGMKRVKRRIHLREDHHRDASIESLLQRMNGVVATAEDSIVGGKIQRRSLVAFCLLLQYWQAPFFYLEVSRSKTTSTCP